MLIYSSLPKTISPIGGWLIDLEMTLRRDNLSFESINTEHLSVKNQLMLWWKEIGRPQCSNDKVLVWKFESF